jgi:hypothetical protein
MLENGVYFGLSFEDYLAEPRLSSSGIKDLGVHPLHFWAHSWLNGAREESEEESYALKLGTAYHKRVIEGRAAFESLYAPYLDKADYPEALITMDDVRAACRERNVKPLTGKKEVLVDRLLQADPAVQVWDELVKDYASDNPGKTFLSARALADIEIRARMIEAHPELSKAFTGGLPEVTVLWTEHAELEGGVVVDVPMKARIDYLKARAIVDLKTFSNPLNKPIDRAIVGEIANRKYFIQAALYDTAANVAADFIAKGQVHDACPDPDAPKRMKVCEREFLFVFQMTGPAPIAKGVVLNGMIKGFGKHAVTQGIQAFAEHFEHYGADPWVSPEPITTPDSTDFPSWTGE